MKDGPTVVLEDMFALYFYRALDPVRGEFDDLSCRRDPDFDHLTLGICRPAVRKLMCEEALKGRVSIVFYTRKPHVPALFLRALLTLKSDGVFGSHREAADDGLSRPLPYNLLVPRNRCICGTAFSNRSAMRSKDPDCDCARYVGRESTPYLRFDKDAARIPGEPIEVDFEQLKSFLPKYFRRWPTRKAWGVFQKAVQNSVHMIEDKDEQDALRALFREVPVGEKPHARRKSGVDASARRHCRR